MGLQKYRFDSEGEQTPKGSVPIYSIWLGGPSLAAIRNCPCTGFPPRTVYVQGEADTWFSIPAAISVGHRRVKGFLTFEDGEYLFHPDKTETPCAADHTTPPRPDPSPAAT